MGVSAITGNQQHGTLLSCVKISRLVQTTHSRTHMAVQDEALLCKHPTRVARFTQIMEQPATDFHPLPLPRGFGSFRALSLQRSRQLTGRCPGGGRSGQMQPRCQISRGNSCVPKTAAITGRKHTIQHETSRVAMFKFPCMMPSGRLTIDPQFKTPARSNIVLRNLTRREDERGGARWINIFKTGNKKWLAVRCGEGEL